MIYVLIMYFLFGGAYWLATIYSMVQTARKVPRLDCIEVPEPAGWPGVTIVVPACNEERDIRQAAASLLAVDYPNLEVLLVDDRSTDRTGAIMDELAAADGRVRVVHIRELPDGWMGKNHAMHVASRAVRSEWVLFTDGDVEFRPQALRQAIAYATSRGLDHLAAYPALYANGLLLDAMIVAFLRMLGLSLRMWKVNDPRSRAFMGVGAFNLVRVESLRRAGGFEAIRMDVGDDVALGMILRQSGARQGLVNAAAYIGLHWYHTIGQMVRAAERGYASVGMCNPVRSVAVAVLLAAMELSLVVALLPLGLPWAQGVAAVVLAGYVAASFHTSRWARVRFLPSLLWPLAVAIMTWMGLRSAVLGWRRGGIAWRGTHYSSAALKAGMKLRF